MMNHKDYMQYVIDWTLDQKAFKQQVRDLIYQARKGGKVLALPFQVYPGQSFFDLLVALLSHLNCESCDALCCKSNPEGPLRLLPPEFKKLASKYGENHFIPDGDSGILPMPCPFLKHNRCIIYPDRPLVCVIYPFQPGANDGAGNQMMALASSCPDARRITKAAYMMSWRIRQQFYSLGEENFLGIFRR
ncbi:unnamed protein product [marine sediment metagenome]|uniref:YkgJ family cysteine cluster protein n=1 Tax=marine sediment metagenome TaxID=412755 RepID=X1TRJ8_9ZZZZ